MGRLLFITWVGVILASLHFGRSAAEIIQERGGLGGIFILVAGAGAGLAWLVIKLKRLPRESRSTGLAVTVLCALMLVALAWIQPLLIERTHVVLYGVLGVLAWNLWAGKQISASRRLVYAALLCALVGFGDEIIQHFHPQRVGDLRDALTNTVAGCIAALLARALDTGLPEPADS